MTFGAAREMIRALAIMGAAREYHNDDGVPPPFAKSRAGEGTNGRQVSGADLTTISVSLLQDKSDAARKAVLRRCSRGRTVNTRTRAVSGFISVISTSRRRSGAGEKEVRSLKGKGGEGAGWM